MAKVYVDMNHPENGIVKTWKECEELKAQGGTHFKSFESEDKANEFIKDSEAYMKGEQKDKQKKIENDVVSSEKAKNNLMGVTVGNAKTSISDDSIVNACKEKTKAIYDIFEEVIENPIDISEFKKNEEIKKLRKRYGFDFSDLSSNKNMAFVDGGGDKTKDTFRSTRIPFGVVFYDAAQKEIFLYRYAFEEGTGFDWLFKASNVSGEELAALCAIYIASKKGIKQLYVYQDNNLPAKYFAGKFKNIHDKDNYMLQIFILESLKYLEQKLDINILYVPSEHAAHQNKAKADKGRKIYDSQEVEKVPFEMAEFFNGVSDKLADYRI